MAGLADPQRAPVFVLKGCRPPVSIGQMMGRLVAALSVALAGAALAQGSPPALPTISALFDWAEASYPAHFPAGPVNQQSPPYTYRYYPSTRNYVGVAGSGVYILGPVAGSETNPLYVGEIASYACPVAPAACGLKRMLGVTVAGLAREFIVYQPWQAQASGRVPVVLVLHGTSGDGERFFNQSGWREKADREGFIVVFPSALVHCFREDDNGDGAIAATELHVSSKWAAGKLGRADSQPLCGAADLAQLPAAARAAADHALADDMAFIGQLLDTVAAQWPADMKRIYVSGFSNGAEMTSRLAAQMSIRFAAAAPVSGGLNVDALPAAWPLPVAFAVGAQDPMLLAAWGYTGAAPLGIELMANPLVQARLVQPWTAVLALAPGYGWSTQRVNSKTISRFEFSASTGAEPGPRFSASLIEGADHLYPNGSNHPVVMADLLWDFFRPLSLP